MAKEHIDIPHLVLASVLKLILWKPDRMNELRDAITAAYQIISCSIAGRVASCLLSKQIIDLIPQTHYVRKVKHTASIRQAKATTVNPKINSLWTYICSE